MIAVPFTPRPYQVECKSAIKAALANHKSAAIELATGLGKSEIIVDYALDMDFGRGMILVHTKELAVQIALTIKRRAGWMPEIEQGDLWANESQWGRSDIVVVSKDSLHLKRLKATDHFGNKRFQDIGLLVTDEAHHHAINNRSYRQIYEHLLSLNPDLRHLGVTATLKRHDKSAMSQIYETCCYQLGICEAIDDGWLVPAQVACEQILSMDFSKIDVNRKTGDFKEAELSAVMENDAPIHEIALATLKDGGGDLRTIVFCPSVVFARDLAAIFQKSYGASADWICGDRKRCSPQRRAEVLEAFANHDLNIICNVAVLTEGFDDPTIEHIVMAKPTASLPRYQQMFGRGTRPLKGVVDFPDSTADSRKAAIAASGKPYIRVTDLVDASMRHKIITSPYVLSGELDARVLERASDNIRKQGGRANVAEEIDKAKQELEAEARRRREKEEEDRRLARAASVKATAEFNTKYVDPFSGKASYSGTTKQKRTVMLWGKYKGCPINEVDTGYLMWFAREMKKAPPWFIGAIKEEIKRRDRPMPMFRPKERYVSPLGAESWRKPTATMETQKKQLSVDEVNQMLLELAGG